MKNALPQPLSGQMAPSAAVRRGFLTSMVRFLEVFGDPWSVLILRDLFLGVDRFDGFQRRLGINRQTLSKRLNGFVDAEILTREKYQDRPTRFRYVMTSKGLDLYDFALSIWRWQSLWAPETESMLPRNLYHVSCGNNLAPVFACDHCESTLRMADIEVCSFTATPKVPRLSPRARRLASDPSRNGGAKGLSAATGTLVIGDRWSNLILASVMLGVKSFDELSAELEIATNTLSHRLGLLRETGLLISPRYDSESRHYHFDMSDAGKDLFGVFLSISQWSDQWLAPPGQPNMYWHHKTCDHPFRAVIVDDHCRARARLAEVRLVRSAE